MKSQTTPNEGIFENTKKEGTVRWKRLKNIMYDKDAKTKVKILAVAD